jgi:hypothetical protein
VPEHVETRSLYNSEFGLELEQGKVQMWIDMFPLSENALPPPVDISLRKPKKFQLRIIIISTKDVILDDINFITLERSSDIYVNGFVCDTSNQQQTDVHYRSLNGDGQFNFRFLFDFDYLPGEKRIVFNENASFFSNKKIERKLKPILTLECYDDDKLTMDDKLGELELDLKNFIKGSENHQNCTVKMLKNKDWPKIDLFKKKSCKGWWPFVEKFHTDKSSLKLTVN